MATEVSNKGIQIFQFVPFQSFVNPTFWYKLSDIKLENDRLSDAPKTIYGYYTNFNPKSCLIEVDYSSFNKNFAPPKNCHTCLGTLYNKNTIEEFKECDKRLLLEIEGEKFLSDVFSGCAIEDPKLLARFMILSFADLKSHTFYYWFAFPCPLNISLKSSSRTEVRRLTDISELCHFVDIIAAMKLEEMNFFILKKSNSSRHFTLKEIIDKKNLSDNFANVDMEDYYFCFSDPSEYENPSWLMRTFASFLFLTCPCLVGKNIQFIAVRFDSNMKFDNSLVYCVFQPEQELLENTTTSSKLEFIGWEMNRNNKMGPRMVSLSDSMDPAKLAEKTINLNLKLMKWRLLPDLDLEKNFKTKCLLFGAGTLGCAVARNLLAWGFKYITLIDGGKVSVSNPVRQNLYTHADAVCGNAMKATTAAHSLMAINPNTVAEGYVIQIPMPGHTIGESMKESANKDLEKIIALVQAHDVLFLLTDSRESRWLPTLLGAAHKKIVINTALGFDSYLVTRHGSLKSNDTCDRALEEICDLKCIPGSDLGCYFCNDVTAPGNSLKDRTLDQQCTVTRPGVSNIAASYAVELLVAILQHPQQDLAPAYYSTNGRSSSKIPEGILGILPHSIRGMICTFENILPATMRFNQCIACSKNVIKEYFDDGKEFLFKVFETSKYLEKLTGISDFEDLSSEIIEYDDGESDESTE